jgi:hypothetical protein
MHPIGLYRALYKGVVVHSQTKELIKILEGFRLFYRVSNRYIEGGGGYVLFVRPEGTYTPTGDQPYPYPHALESHPLTVQPQNPASAAYSVYQSYYLTYLLIKPVLLSYQSIYTDYQSTTYPQTVY